MVTNPFDTFDIQANATIQNAAGVYVMSLPFNPIPTESVFVPQGQVVFFVKGIHCSDGEQSQSRSMKKH